VQEFSAKAAKLTTRFKGDPSLLLDENEDDEGAFV